MSNHSPFPTPNPEGFLYPFLEDEDTTSAESVLGEVRESTLLKCREIADLRRQVLDRHADDLVRAARAIASAFVEGRRLFAFGNGGSSTDAADLVADLVCPPPPTPMERGVRSVERAGMPPNLAPHSSLHAPWGGGRRGWPAIALSNDIATVTAVGNDVGFENVFSRQLIAFGQKGDVALGISTSGSSANIVAAFETAKRRGMVNVAIVGYDGGRCAVLAREGVVDHVFVVPSTHVPRIQEAQATIYHTLVRLVTMMRAT